MKIRKLITTLALTAACSGMLFAASAKSLYTEFSDAASSGDVQLAIEKYTELGKKVESEADSANKSIEKALKKNNGTLYRNAADELKTLSSYVITPQQSDQLLTAILNEDESRQSADAAWLYENSYSYSPVLTFSYESSEPGFSFNFSSSISVKPGTEVTPPSSDSISVSTARTGQLAGWGLTPDSNDYAPGETITMPLTSQTLYAQWQSAVSFKDERSSTDVVVTDTEAGSTVTVPQPVAEDGAIFAGWYDSSSGFYIEPGVTEYTVKGKGATFTALWENITVSRLQSGNYDINAIPTGVQIPLSLTISNTGTETVRDLAISVTTDSENATLLNSEAYSRGLQGGRSANMTGVKLVVDKGTASGTVIPITVTVTDSNGNTYSSLFNCTVK